MFRICIVGCGLTGAVTAKLLKQRLPHLNIVILEKSKGTGGRMCTSRHSFGSTVDLGAQFITKTSILSETQKKCYSDLLQAGILKPLQKSIEGLKITPLATEHFICPNGSGSVVKHFLKSSDCKILFGHRVTEVKMLDDKWAIMCENESSHEFDAVIFTIPVPQILQIGGLTGIIQDHDHEKLKAVKYCSRFAVGLFYNSNIHFENLPWTAKFITDDPVVRFCALDYQKRGLESATPTLVFHTTKEFGAQYVDKDVSFVQDLFFERLEKTFPDVPKPNDVKFHKWRYSQVESSYSGQPGSLVISNKPLLITGGDGFSFSTFEGCIHSAESIVQNVTRHANTS